PEFSSRGNWSQVAELSSSHNHDREAASLCRVNVRGGASQCFLSPLIEALARQFSGESRFLVNLWRNSEHDFPGIWFLRLLANLGAGLEVVVYRLVEGVLEIRHGLGMKTDLISYTGNVTNENRIV